MISGVVLLTERERTYTDLLLSLDVYPGDNILCALVSQVIDGKLHEEPGSVIWIKPAVILLDKLPKRIPINP